MTKLAQIALQQGMRIEADAVAVNQPMRRIGFQQRAKIVNGLSVETVELGKLRDFTLERIERVDLVIAGVDEHRHRMPQGRVREAGRRVLDETAASERQFSNQAVAEEVMQHRRAAAR